MEIYISESELNKAKAGEPYNFSMEEKDGLVRIDLSLGDLRAFSISNGSAVFDENYVAPITVDLAKSLIIAKKTIAEEVGKDFAAENSIILSQKIASNEITEVEAAGLVLNAAAQLKTANEYFSMYCFDAGMLAIDNIVNEPVLLSVERITTYKNTILSKVAAI